MNMDTETDPPIPPNSDEALIDALVVVDPPVEPQRPNVTPIQYAAIIAVVIQFTRAFGIWDASAEQVDALTAASALLGALVFGDAGLRGLRNLGNR